MVMPITFSSGEDLNTDALQRVRAYMRLDETLRSQGGKGLVTASMGVSSYETALATYDRTFKKSCVRTIWLNVCMHVLYCFRLVDVHVELYTSVYGS